MRLLFFLQERRGWTERQKRNRRATGRSCRGVRHQSIGVVCVDGEGAAVALFQGSLCRRLPGGAVYRLLRLLAKAQPTMIALHQDVARRHLTMPSATRAPKVIGSAAWGRGW